MSNAYQRRRSLNYSFQVCSVATYPAACSSSTVRSWMIIRRGRPGPITFALYVGIALPRVHFSFETL